MLKKKQWVSSNKKCLVSSKNKSLYKENVKSICKSFLTRSQRIIL